MQQLHRDPTRADSWWLEQGENSLVVGGRGASTHPDVLCWAGVRVCRVFAWRYLERRYRVLPSPTLIGWTMNQAESSGSDDDMDDERALDEIAQAVLESEGLGVVPPEVQREQDILAELARKRAERDDAGTVRRKSDEIFDRFDVDRDAHLNYRELRELGRATGGELPQAAYKSICEEIGADPSKGVTKALLLVMYTDAGLGDPHRDYNLIFNPA
jgi:hypothetical protein